MSAGFKRTEVGVIPKDWLLKQAGSLGVFRGGNGFPLAFQGQKEGAYPFFKVSDMSNTGNGRELIQANHYISKVVRDRLRAFVFPTNTIVFAKIGAAIFLERKKRLGQPSCIDNNLAGFMLQDAGSSIGYLSYFFQSLRLGGLVSATALPSLSGKVLGAIQIPLPSTKLEQDKIAEVLSDADALIESLQQLIAKKRALKQSAMQALLTGDERLPSFSGDWKRVSLRDVSTSHSGVWGSDHVTDRSTRRVRVIRAGDISQDGALTGFAARYLTPDEYQKGRCELDDVVVTTSGNGLGKTWWVDGRRDMAASNFVRVLRARADLVSGKFLSYVLRSDTGLRQLAEHTATSAYPNLRPSFFSADWVELPPLNEQLAIASVLSDMDEEINALDTRLAKTRDLKAGMMQALLIGRIRLPLEQAAWAVDGGVNGHGP